MSKIYSITLLVFAISNMQRSQQVRCLLILFPQLKPYVPLSKLL